MSSEPKPTSPCRVVLRPWPKVIFLYPTMLAAFICGSWQFLDGGGTESEQAGLIFFTVLAANLLVFSFEFSRLKTISILLFLVAVVFLLLYLGTKYEVLAFMRRIIDGLHLRTSSSFYFALGGYLLAVFLLIFLNTRWNYFEVRHNEIVHHTGFLGDIRRFPSPSLKFTKEISDVFEFLLLGSGRIILYPTSEKEAIVLDNVLNVNRLESQMKKMLSAIATVEVDGQHQHSEPEE